MSIGGVPALQPTGNLPLVSWFQGIKFTARNHWLGVQRTLAMVIRRLVKGHVDPGVADTQLFHPTRGTTPRHLQRSLYEGALSWRGITRSYAAEARDVPYIPLSTHLHGVGVLP